VWTEAKKVYFNDVHRVYNFFTALTNIKLENADIADMPFTTDVETFYKQHDQFFMVLALIGLPSNLDAVCNRILSGPIVPTCDMV